jgi:MFS family permease
MHSSDSRAEEIAAAGEGGVSGRNRWYLVAVLTLTMVLSFTDRNVFSLAIEPIKHDLGISDVQISLLIGVSFISLYSVCSIAFGYFADVANRTVLIGTAVLFWSSMSALCGFASNYWQLAIGRAGIGIGEAALQPNAVSLIRDAFPLDQRGRAFGIYGIGPVLGVGLATLVGGLLYTFAASGSVADWPILGALRPWQFMIAVPGLFGLPIALLLFTVREPKRQRGSTKDATSNFGEMLDFLWRERRLTLPLFAGPTIWSMANSGWMAWMPAAMARGWHISPGEFGRYAGPITLILTPIGLITIGILMDRLSRAGMKDGHMRVAAITQLIQLIPALLIFQMPTQESRWIMYAVSVVISSQSVQVAASAILSHVTPGRLMGKTAAVFNLVQNVLGLALGPTIYALVAQLGFSGPRAILYSMMACYGALMPVAALLLLMVGRAIRNQVP